MSAQTEEALKKLGERFQDLPWNFQTDSKAGKSEKISQWLGGRDEDVMLCVFQGRRIHEPFHRQDFFFYNFAWHGDYTAVSAQSDRTLVMREGDCYLGQPYSGYALRADAKEPVTILGVLFRREVFLRDFLPTLSTDAAMLSFFLNPDKDRYSDEYIHLRFPKDSPVWKILSLMAVEYEGGNSDTGGIVKSLALALTMYIAREYRKERENQKEQQAEEDSPVSAMLRYISLRSDTVTLQELAEKFGYHPNYVSALLHQKSGHTFSEIVQAERMKKAWILVQKSGMSLEEISSLVGYSDTSSFYKAFRRVYHMTPREAAESEKVSENPS